MLRGPPLLLRPASVDRLSLEADAEGIEEEFEIETGVGVGLIEAVTSVGLDPEERKELVKLTAVGTAVELPEPDV